MNVTKNSEKINFLSAVNVAATIIFTETILSTLTVGQSKTEWKSHWTVPFKN